MYELTYGFTPFKGAKRDITFENIMKKPLEFPAKPEISAECKVKTIPLSSCERLFLDLEKDIRYEEPKPNDLFMGPYLHTSEVGLAVSYGF